MSKTILYLLTHIYCTSCTSWEWIPAASVALPEFFSFSPGLLSLFVFLTLMQDIPVLSLHQGQGDVCIFTVFCFCAVL